MSKPPSLPLWMAWPLTFFTGFVAAITSKALGGGADVAVGGLALLGIYLGIRNELRLDRRDNA